MTEYIASGPAGGVNGRRPLISFEDAALGYGREPVLSSLSFAIRDGDFLGLVGPNGSGKTTILRAALGTLAPLRGRVVIHGADIRFGYVPQRSAMDYGWPFDTVDVVAMGQYDRIGLFRRPGPAHRAAALEAMDHVGIRDLAAKRFSSLSGGQKQRALIARALVGRPTLLVLDEPTDGMDLASTTAILELVKRLHEQDRLTVLMVSHQLNDVANYVARLALVVPGGGFQIGDVDEVLTDRNLSALYHMPVEVDRVGRRRLILPAAPPTSTAPDRGAERSRA